MKAEDEFLRLLDPDPDRAAALYADLYRRLVRFFEWRNCRSPEDLAQETLTRGLIKISKGVEVYTDNPASYFFGIAKNVVREDRRPRPDAFSVSLDDLPEVAFVDYCHVDTQIYLEQCLSRLQPSERELLFRFHTEDHETVCRQLGLSANALRVKAHRARKKLEQLMLRATSSVRLVK